MSARTVLILLFAGVLGAMLVVTSWASVVQPIWDWQGLKNRPDHAWTIATLFDAYFGFLTFYCWVYYKERAPGRAGWFVFIMAFGNIAMASYLLRELFRLKPGEPVSTLLLRRA
jgi:hypothetical protein